ncbi:MAG TPA: hypothetical protein VD794_00130, partial [Flavisolibacter sp.]|nr:hypothetical protein [Flavisolibacter sp.]
MKYLLLSILSIVFVLSAAAQDSSIALSKIEVFSSRPGRLIKTEIKELGVVSAVAVAKVKAVDVASGESFSAIKIYGNWSEPIPTVSSKAVYIDLEELDGVINALSYFLEEAQKAKPVNNHYYSYVTPGDVEFSCFYSGSGFGFWDFNIGRV